MEHDGYAVFLNGHDGVWDFRGAAVSLQIKCTVGCEKFPESSGIGKIGRDRFPIVDALNNEPVGTAYELNFLKPLLNSPHVRV